MSYISNLIEMIRAICFQILQSALRKEKTRGYRTIRPIFGICCATETAKLSDRGERSFKFVIHCPPCFCCTPRAADLQRSPIRILKRFLRRSQPYAVQHCFAPNLKPASQFQAEKEWFWNHGRGVSLVHCSATALLSPPPFGAPNSDVHKNRESSFLKLDSNRL